MSAIESKFANLQRSGSKAIIPYLTAGHPTLAATTDIIVALAAAGAAVIEVGVPFSDPMADGPVIQRACEHALRGGTTLRGVLDAIRAARSRTDVPIVLFSYLNPLVQYGLARLTRDAAEAGVSGVLVTDMPLESAAPFSRELHSHDIDLISLIAPTSTDERIAAIARASRGFLYAVSRTGVTGTREQISDDARALVARIRRATQLPVALGFGISTPEQAREVLTYVDASVIGSALVREIGAAGEQRAAQSAHDFLHQFTNIQAAAAATEK